MGCRGEEELGEVGEGGVGEEKCGAKYEEEEKALQDVCCDNGFKAARGCVKNDDAPTEEEEEVAFDAEADEEAFGCDNLGDEDEEEREDGKERGELAEESGAVDDFEDLRDGCEFHLVHAFADAEGEEDEAEGGADGIKECGPAISIGFIC